MRSRGSPGSTPAVGVARRLGGAAGARDGAGGPSPDRRIVNRALHQPLIASPPSDPRRPWPPVIASPASGGAKQSRGPGEDGGSHGGGRDCFVGLAALGPRRNDSDSGTARGRLGPTAGGTSGARTDLIPPPGIASPASGGAKQSRGPGEDGGSHGGGRDCFVAAAPAPRNDSDSRTARGRLGPTAGGTSGAEPPHPATCHCEPRRRRGEAIPRSRRGRRVARWGTGLLPRPSLRSVLVAMTVIRGRLGAGSAPPAAGLLAMTARGEGLCPHLHPGARHPAPGGPVALAAVSPVASRK